MDYHRDKPSSKGVARWTPPNFQTRLSDKTFAEYCEERAGEESENKSKEEDEDEGSAE
ncbi:hypothetical protein FRC11_006620, partial [Ceratobasidium sp. 423]